MEVPHEEENFFRVSKLVYNEITAQLRSFFKHKWKFKFNLDWDDSPTSGDTLLKKIPSKTKSYLKKEMKDKFKEGSSQEWDCSTLFQVLLYAGLKLTDSKEEKAVDGLRLVRNEQCSHLADSKITDDTFDNIFKNVRMIYTEMGWMNDRLDKIQNGIFETKDHKETKRKLEEEKRAALRKDQEDFDNLPKSDINFVGREQEIQDAMENIGNGGEKNFLLIHGGPCYGKSTLAINLGHKMIDEGVNFVIWVNMRDISSDDSCPSLENLAEKILHEFDIDTKEMETFEFCLHQKLSMISSSGKKALLLFDNADCFFSNNDIYSQLVRLLSTNMSNNIRAIFTSRGNFSSDRELHKIELRRLADDDCRHYLDLSLKNETLVAREQLINQLATWSRRLPLALKILASEVNEMEDKECLEAYLKDVEQDPAQTISENEEEQMFRLFEASFKNMGAGEMNLMKLLAVFPSGFSYKYVEKLTRIITDKVIKGRWIHTLRKRGLVEKPEPNFLIHPFLCEFIKTKWKDLEKSKYEQAYTEVYLKSLFELSIQSLEKDKYSTCLEEFSKEKYNFSNAMSNLFGLSDGQNPEVGAVSEANNRLFARQTSDFLSVMVFLLNMVRPDVLIKFFKNCEQIVADNMKPNIWCIRYELEVKYSAERPQQPSGYPQPDSYASFLKDSRDLNTRVYKFNKLGCNAEETDGKLQGELNEASRRVMRFENVNIRAYFAKKMLKLRAKLHVRCKELEKAREAFQEALTICLQVFGASWLTFDCYEQLAKFHTWSVEEYETASSYYEKADSMALEILAKNDKRYNIHLLDKGRFLINAGSPADVKEGVILLEKVLESCDYQSDARYWSDAVGVLASIDPCYYERVIPYLCSLESPSQELCELVARKFKYEMSQTERNCNEEKIKKDAFKAIDELNKAINHVTNTLENLNNQKREDLKSKLLTTIFQWNNLLAKRTPHILLLSERAHFAMHALDAAEKGSLSGYDGIIESLKQMIEQTKKCTKEEEELLKRKEFLVRARKCMENEGRSSEFKELYKKLIEDCRPEQLYLITRIFSFGMNAVKRETNEAEIKFQTSKAIEDLKVAIEHIVALHKNLGSMSKNSQEKKGQQTSDKEMFTLYQWNMLLATRTDHYLTNSERRPFAKEALRIAAKTTTITVDEKTKKSLIYLQDWSTKAPQFEQFETRKQFLIANTKALRDARMIDQLEERYQGFLNDSMGYPRPQFHLIKHILQHKTVAKDRYPEYLGILVDLIREQRLTSGWDLQVVIDNLPTTLQHDNSLQCQRKGLSLCQRLYNFLSSTRRDFSLCLQKKFEFQLLKMLCLDTGGALVELEKKKHYAATALLLDRNFKFSEQEQHFSTYVHALREILES
eukprot:Seg446.15 transcript_id=Seg446.15/GoldUCD/mRNA.D3Y31 product="hypothetical protein" protein_id=Seg446.15/GoldUCD/D3Y31